VVRKPTVRPTIDRPIHCPAATRRNPTAQGAALGT
jgi:hypothetical protein